MPLIVVKRKTVEARFFRTPISDKIYISDNEWVFITSEIFNDWAENIPILYIKEKREKLKYQGPAVLILDGCSCHYTPTLYRFCAENSIKIFFLPPHSSNQTQPLDLVIFHLHKDKIRQHIKIESDDFMLAEKLTHFYSAFQSIAILEHIKASFEAAGAVYDKSNTLNPIVHFDRNFATHLLSNPKSIKEKKALSRKRKGLDLQDHETRINIEDIRAIWKNDESAIARIEEKMKNVPRIIDPVRDAPPTQFNWLLQAFVRTEGVENSQFYLGNRKEGQESNSSQKKHKKMKSGNNSKTVNCRIVSQAFH